MEKMEHRERIRKEIIEYFRKKEKKEFVPGKHKVQYTGPIYDEREAVAFIDSFLDGWFGVGKKSFEFEDRLTEYIGTKSGVLTNSGSSANLLAVSALKSKQFPSPLKNGDEIITTATVFPTTVNPIIQNNLKPVFIDVELGTYNARIDAIREAIGKKTKAIFITHTLGNPCEMDALMDLIHDKKLILIEDNCDALGAEYGNKKCGSFGLMSTYSFYVAHHITMGEGGAVLVRDEKLDPLVRSLRDWGRACTCRKCKVIEDPNFQCDLRYQMENYDGRYLYTNLGYNLKPLEFQAAFGLEQFKKLPEFLKSRENNFNELHNEFKKYEDIFILPRSLPKAKPAWFSFPITIRKEAGFERETLIKFLEAKNIESRFLFAGNILKHPAYKNIPHRQVGNLKNSDCVMHNSFFLGVYPGLDKQKMDYIKKSMEEFISKFG